MASVLAAEGPGGPLRSATVREFDEDAGLGVVEVDGVGSVPFHCTAIADGTRTISVGVAVVCRIVPGHLGRPEAASLTGVANPGGGPRR